MNTLTLEVDYFSRSLRRWNRPLRSFLFRTSLSLWARVRFECIFIVTLPDIDLGYLLTFTNPLNQDDIFAESDAFSILPP